MLSPAYRICFQGDYLGKHHLPWYQREEQRRGHFSEESPRKTCPPTYLPYLDGPDPNLWTVMI